MSDPRSITINYFDLQDLQAATTGNSMAEDPKFGIVRLILSCIERGIPAFAVLQDGTRFKLSAQDGQFTFQ
jgi:hypothetical protein